MNTLKVLSAVLAMVCIAPSARADEKRNTLGFDVSISNELIVEFARHGFVLEMPRYKSKPSVSITLPTGARLSWSNETAQSVTFIKLEREHESAVMIEIQNRDYSSQTCFIASVLFIPHFACTDVSRR